MNYRIGFMGSAGRDRQLPEVLLQTARETGREIARAGCVLVTGACMGTPQEAAIGAREEEGMVLAFSPAANLREHTEPPISYPEPPAGTDLIFTGMSKPGRVVIAIMNCDAVIFCAGSAGTLNEFASAYQAGKVIGLLEGTGGITEKITEIAEAIKKDTGAVVISAATPKLLVKMIVNVLKQRQKR